MENIVYLPTEDLVDYSEHPYKVLDNDDMRELAKSIEEYAVLEPLILRPLDDNQYEILSGHRRRMAAEIAGEKTVPAIITNQSDIDAETSYFVYWDTDKKEIVVLFGYDPGTYRDFEKSIDENEAPFQ